MHSADTRSTFFKNKHHPAARAQFLNGTKCAQNAILRQIVGKSGHGALADGVPCSFWVYVCYILYPPLYISGPIISYEDFAAQLTTDADADKVSVSE